MPSFNLNDFNFRGTLTETQRVQFEGILNFAKGHDLEESMLQTLVDKQVVIRLGSFNGVTDDLNKFDENGLRLAGVLQWNPDQFELITAGAGGSGK